MEPQYPTVSGDFNKRQFGSQFDDETTPKKPNGIQNPSVTYGVRVPADNRRGGKKPHQLQPGSSSLLDDRSRGRKQITPETETEEPTEQQNQTQRQPRGAVRTIKAVIRKNAIRARLTPVIAGISAWAFFFYIGQLIMGCLSLVGLGIAVLMEASTGTAATVTAGIASQIEGLDFSAGMVIYIAFCFLIMFFYLIQIAIGTVMFKIALVHPWFGAGAGFKVGSIIFILISSFVPILNLFPLFWLWLFAVMLNPR